MVCSKPCWFLYMLWIIIYLWIAFQFHFHFHCFYHITCRCEWELRILNLCVFMLEMYTLKKFNQNTTTTTTKTIIFVFCLFVCLSYESVDCICEADVESYTQLLNISWFSSLWLNFLWNTLFSHNFSFIHIFSPTGILKSNRIYNFVFMLWTFLICVMLWRIAMKIRLQFTSDNCKYFNRKKGVWVGLNLRFWLSFLPLTSVIFWIIHN